MVQTLGGLVEMVEIETRSVKAIQERKRRRISLPTRPEDKIIGEGRLSRFRKEVQYLAEYFVQWGVIIFQKPI